jgi:D-alanine-D-alanine ligase
MDKDVSKRLLRDAGLPIVPYFALSAREAQAPGFAAVVAARIQESFGFPCFVKPANSGSSVGVHKVRAAANLGAALADALKYDHKVLVERAVDAREIECSVLGNDEPICSVPGEIVPHADFYSYQAKYVDDDGAALVIPAALTAAQVADVQAAALAVFAALDLQGMARIDFLMDRQTGRFFVNEANTIPGFTKISMYPKLWAASGVSYPALVDRLIELALERHRARAALSTRYVP